VALGLGLVLAMLGAERAAAEKDGIDSNLYYPGAIGCGSPDLFEAEGCHAEFENELVSVSIDGPDDIALGEAPAAAAFVVLAETSLEGQQGAGVNVFIDPAVSTSDCQLGTFPTPENNQLVPEGPVLTHRDAEVLPPLGSVGVFSYQFLLMNCNAPGTVRVLVAMNTFNFDGESTGDAWNKTEKTVTVPEPGGAGAAWALAATLSRAAWARRRRSNG
jgi:hypothetical protein